MWSSIAGSKKQREIFCAFLLIEIALLITAGANNGWKGDLGMLLALFACFWSLSVLQFVIQTVVTASVSPRNGTRTALMVWIIKMPLTFAFLGAAVWLSKSHPTPLIFEVIMVYSFAVLGLIGTDKQSTRIP